MNTRPPESEALLTPAEVAAMFRVDPKTVTRWAKAGKLSSIRTLGGHRRYRESEVRELLSGMVPEQRRGDDGLTVRHIFGGGFLRGVYAKVFAEGLADAGPSVFFFPRGFRSACCGPLGSWVTVCPARQFRGPGGRGSRPPIACWSFGRGVALCVAR